MNSQMDVFPLHLKNFHVSEKTGFLLENPLATLPKYFEPWNNLAVRMAELVTEKSMRKEVARLPVLDTQQLSGHCQLRLAHLQLSIIAAGYVWEEGDSGAARVLPACLAVPWHTISTQLGLPLIICHSSLMLANWVRDESGTIHCIYQLPGGAEADWFITVTVEVELAFGAGIRNLMSLLYHAQCEDLDEMVICLNKLCQTIQNMQNEVAKMHNLSAETFYNKLRPFLAGWGGEGSPLPDGIIYEGVCEKPWTMTGGSAAQSCTVQSIDAVLGVIHKPDIVDFMTKMRSYMLPSHRQFIDMIEQHSQVKQVVHKQTCDRLTSAYNQALKAVVEFRTYHIQIVTKYIILQANQEARSKDHESLATKGTGGSSLVPFLKSLRTSTSSCLLIKDNVQKQNDDQ